ncbi:MAG: ABC transporter substrate-binding protein [Thermaceae bacterium]|nr:ABC transporter substrate-binding protein [Thermaceae bacterium]
MKSKWLAGALTLMLAGGVASAQGATITIACGAVGQELQLCKQETEAWAKKTGNTVKVLETPQLTNNRLALYQQNLSAGNSDIDIYQIDVIHPGILGSFFIDLRPLIPAADISVQNQGIIANNTYDGKLIAMPWFTDGGVLYYRTDLLKKYGFKEPPTTWAQMFLMAKVIQAGERKANPNFYGFVYQGNAYEGLTCDALEWIASYGGGTIVDDKGNVTINNPKAIEALNFIAQNSKQVSPPGVTTYDEEAARGVFQSGNAAFMRNWPYAYSLGESAGSAVKGKLAVAPLPHGPGGQSVGTLGGWQLAVSKFSKHQKEAADLVAYLSSEAVQKQRAIEGSFQPTIPALYKDPEVLKAVPFFKDISGRVPVARPSTVTGAKYNQVSTAFWNAVHSVLTGQMDGKAALSGLATQLNQIKGPGW